MMNNNSLCHIFADASKTYQTYKGIGASGAWWAQDVGKWTSLTNGVPTKDVISSLLYSKEKGIGLNIFRYNLGAGSAQSGRGEYSDPLRRAESFDKGDGKYDFTADNGAVYMMKKAVEDGADEVIFFVNSPIERLTKNHCGHSNQKRVFRTNLDKKNIPSFCKYCLDVTEHFIGEGVPVKYLSPVNEPLWIWNGGQEGCHYKPWQAARVFGTFAEEMEKRRSLKGVKLSGFENGDIRWLNKSYTRALMKNKKVRERVDGVDVHSYFLNPVKPFFSNRQAYLKRFAGWFGRKYPGKDIVMSEWCHMNGGRDKGMNSALVTAETIIDDMGLMNASSWQHWIACSPYDYCDGVIYIDCEKQTFELTKRYFVTGNISKYVPLGAKRIEAKTDTDDVKLIAFTDNKKIYYYIMNKGNEDKCFTFTSPFMTVLTDETHDLYEENHEPGEFVLPAGSVCTVITGYSL